MGDGGVDLGELFGGAGGVWVLDSVSNMFLLLWMERHIPAHTKTPTAFH